MVGEMSDVTAGILERALSGVPGVRSAIAAAHVAAWASTDPETLELCRARIATLLGSEETAEYPIDTDLVAAIPSWPTSPLFTDAQRACLAFTEQFVIDVASLDDSTVAAVVESLGTEGFVNFVNALLVVEQRQRMRLAWLQLLERPRSEQGAGDQAGGSTAAAFSGPGGRRGESDDHAADGGRSSGPGPGRRSEAVDGDRIRRVPDGATAVGPLRYALGMMHVEVMALDSLDLATVEMVRLRAAGHHDCRT